MNASVLNRYSLDNDKFCLFLHSIASTNVLVIVKNKMFPNKFMVHVLSFMVHVLSFILKSCVMKDLSSKCIVFIYSHVRLQTMDGVSALCVFLSLFVEKTTAYCQASSQQLAAQLIICPVFIFLVSTVLIYFVLDL